MSIITWVTKEESKAEVKIAPKSAKKVAAYECTRCCGSGILSKFRHIEGGRCFACLGSGRLIIRGR